MEKASFDLIKTYKKNQANKWIILCVLLVLIFIFSVIGIGVGTTYVNFGDVVKALFGVGTEDNLIIVQKIRAPRVLAALIAGGGLAISGCVMQNVLKNEMASPSTLGVGNASVFGANLAIIALGAGTYATKSGIIKLNNPYVTSAFALFFALLSVFLILFLARIKHFSNEAIVLAGVAIGTIFNAGTLIIQFFSEDGELASAIFWSFGDLGRANYKECLIMFIVVFIGLIFFMLSRWDYNAISSGKDLAQTLGVKVERTSIISLLLASLITAVCVSFLGIIGFIGLISPQIMKIFVKDDFRFLLPSSFLFGSLLLVVADILSRVVVPGITLPVGAITSLLGGPMFVYLLLRRKARV